MLHCQTQNRPDLQVPPSPVIWRVLAVQLALQHTAQHTWLMRQANQWPKTSSSLSLRSAQAVRKRAQQAPCILAVALCSPA